MNMVKVFIKGLEDKELSSFKLCYYPARIKISLSSNTFEKKKKKGLNPQLDSAQIVIFVFTTIIIDKLGKGTHFFGQPPEDTKIQ